MPDDEKPVRGSERPERDHHFEMPRLVREVHPGERASAASAAPPASPLTEVEPEGSGSAATSEPSTRFARRWDQVQKAFVARGARGSKGATDIAGHPPTTAN